MEFFLPCRFGAPIPLETEKSFEQLLGIYREGKASDSVRIMRNAMNELLVKFIKNSEKITQHKPFLLKEFPFIINKLLEQHNRGGLADGFNTAHKLTQIQNHFTGPDRLMIIGVQESVAREAADQGYYELGHEIVQFAATKIAFMVNWDDSHQHPEYDAVQTRIGRFLLDAEKALMEQEPSPYTQSEKSRLSENLSKLASNTAPFRSDVHRHANAKVSEFKL
ncbi:MAG TPA: hypothetical protein DD400_01915 [Rhodospirillaceae bacterium]|nr:hypothetical protein [Rhodospirillaceae bacterium]